jgi:F-type H+-transporting ATPase subunit delta
MLSVVAKRYAHALVEAITAPGSNINPADVLAELQAVSEIIADSHDLRNAPLSPAVPPARKRAVIARVIEPLGVSSKVRNFLFIVISHRRIHEFDSIVEAFEALMDERLGFVRADVSSAHELPESLKASIVAQLSRMTGKKAKSKFSTDPALLAGVVARVGSKVYDGSARGQLERLRAKLASG